jgi:NAD(P)-dependent dehydrogenase (short-subunit alcohol dehydrogenase family)
VRRVIETNFLGAVAVTEAMLPLMRKSAAGRIVNVSSGLGSLNWNADPDWEFAAVKLIGYCASKAALNMLTIQLVYELRGTTIKVNASNPGYTATANSRTATGALLRAGQALGALYGLVGIMLPQYRLRVWQEAAFQKPILLRLRPSVLPRSHVGASGADPALSVRD